MSLRVQARDRYGNYFAYRTTDNSAEAFDWAYEWIRANPDLVVEVVFANA
jgi:hypothetical protein